MKQELLHKQKLPDGWKWSTLGEECNLKIGGTPSRGNTEYFKGKNLWVSVRDLNGSIINDTSEKITDEALQNSNVKLVKKGTILICFKLSLGKKAIAGKDLYTNEAISALEIRPNSQLTKDFLFYYLDRVNLFDYANTAAKGNCLNKDSLATVKILVPTKNDQLKIVSKLDQQMAQIEIMKKEAENEQRSINDLLQSFLKREILDKTKDWKKFKIEELCFLKTGGTPSKSVKSYWENGNLNWLSSGDVNKEIIYEVDGKITQEGLDNSNARMLPINSVLIALNGQGKTRGMVAILKVESTCNQSLVAIIPKNNNLDYSFLFYYLKASYNKLRNLTGDNERSGLSMRILNNYDLYVPEIKLQKEIVEKIEKFNSEQNNLKEKVNTKLLAISQLPSAILNEIFGKYSMEENGN